MRAVGACILAITAVAASSAHAEVITTVRAGYWSAFGGTADGGAAMCGVSTIDSLGRVFLVKYFDKGPMVIVQIFKQSWQIPAKTSISMRMSMDSYSPWSGNGTGAGERIELPIPGQAIAEFEKEFRRASTLRVTFGGGTEPDMIESLAGSRAVDDELVRCVGKLVQSHQVTQPFSADRGATSQPFNSQPAPTASVPPVVSPPAPPLEASQNL